MESPNEQIRKPNEDGIHKPKPKDFKKEGIDVSTWRRRQGELWKKANKREKEQK